MNIRIDNFYVGVKKTQKTQQSKKEFKRFLLAYIHK